MKFALLFIFLFGFFFLEAQEDTIVTKPLRRAYCKILRHELEVDPISIWYNKGFSLGHRVKYTYILSHYKRFSLDVNGTALKVLDARLEFGERRRVLPHLNQSQLYFERSLPRGTMELGKKFLGLKTIGFRVGYHYFQHASGANYHEYWSIDSLPQTGLRTIAGFKSHSVFVGISTEVIKRTVSGKKEGFARLGKKSHRVSFDYLFCPFYQLKFYDSEAESNFNQETVKSTLPVNRSGAQFQYRFSHVNSKRFGIHADFEALWVPFLRNYKPNYDFFVPRGNERIIPLFLNARVGMYWMF